MDVFTRSAAAVLLVLVTATAQAIPITYGLDLNVQYFFDSPQPQSPAIHIGDTYHGFFTLDSNVLAHDGLNQPGNLSAFSVQLDQLVWDMQLPFPQSEFVGFRGPLGLGASSPGFDIVDGALVNLRGGVFGAADTPSVDFSTDFRVPLVEDPACAATHTSYCGNKPNSWVTQGREGAFGGSMAVYAVPEPEMGSLFAAGIAALAGFIALDRRRQRRRSAIR